MSSLFAGFPPVTSLLPALAAAAALYLVYLVVYHRSGSALGTRPRHDVQTLSGAWPLLGNTLRVAGEKRLLEEWSRGREEAIKKDPTKPFSLVLPFMRAIDISVPEHLEYVQKTNFANYEKGSLQAGIMRDVLGEGIFATDGAKWSVQRKATSKIFSANNFRGVITRAIDDDIAKLTTIIGNHADAGREFDLAALFFAFTLSSFTSMAFGQDIGALKIDDDTPVPFAVAFDFAQSRMDSRVFEPLYPLTELFSSDGRKMRAAVKTISDFAYDIIDKRAKDVELETKGEKEAGADDLLTLYMALRDEKGQPMSRTALRDAVVNLIIAGRDTTAQALSWTYFQLMAQPELFKTLQKEVDEAETIDYDNFKDLTQTLATFNEGMRLHPSVPKNIKTAVADDQIPNGPFIRAGEMVVWNDWSMGRSTDVWGPDAIEFKPSRWIDEAGELVKVSQWKGHWFNGGSRLCLGQNLATFEGAMVLATISKHFDLTFAPGYHETVPMIDLGTTEKTPLYLSSLTLPMNAPLLVKASRRKA